MNNKIYSSVRRVFLKLDELIQFHLTNSVEKKLNKKTEMKKLYDVYKNLDYKFKILETYIREIEQKPKKNYEDFLTLSNYKTILITKNNLFEIQKEIHNELKNKEFIKFSKLYYYKGKVGLGSIDLARYYFNYSKKKINFNNLLKKYFNTFNDKLYFLYFKFYILYTYIINIEINKKKSYVVFNQIAREITIFKTRFHIDSSKTESRSVNN